MKNNLNPYLFFSLFIISISSCATFEPGWNSISQQKGTQNVDNLIKNAKNLELISSSAEEIDSLISVYSEIEKAAPNHYLALWKIGNYHMLMGAAHSTKTKSKKYHYREAIKYCEKAMYTNKEFKQEIKNGKKVSEASKKLTINEIDAMGYWYTARFYYFKECLKPFGKIINTSMVIDNNKVISHIDKLDPNWEGGGNYFSRALYYIATPKNFGGSITKAEIEFTSAINVGPNYLVNRWGRAKYLYSLTGNIEGFKSDMEWVIEQDPHKGGNPYAWNIYFQNDAKKELELISSK